VSAQSNPATRDRIAQIVLKLQIGLLAVVIVGIGRWVAQAPSGARIAGAVLLAAPLLLPLRGLWKRNRRTYAWTTLCLVPYIVIGITELVANPQARDWAIGCLLLSFAAFIGCIAYLRVTRPMSGSADVDT
jgi:uncharacterized membrane protein